MKTRNLVRFNHETKTATFSIIDYNDNILVDNEGRILENMKFPYNHLIQYSDLFERIEDNGVVGFYYFPID